MPATAGPRRRWLGRTVAGCLVLVVAVVTGLVVAYPVAAAEVCPG